MRKFLLYLLLISFVGFMACQEDDEPQLAPADERIEEAIEDLRDELTRPANGWRINYQPIPGGGVYFMLLDFDSDGTVTIQSDVTDNDSTFLEQTINYRIDNALGIELIFETYGVFHFLFELERATFGAEFEFLFVEEDGGNLIFESKSDIFNPTVITFERAGPNDENLFARDLAANLKAFEGGISVLSGITPTRQQLIIPGSNLSIFWNIDLTQRIIDFELAGVGTTLDEIFTGGQFGTLNFQTGYAFAQGAIDLITPLQLNINGQQITIDRIELTELTMTGEAFCEENGLPTPIYNGQIEGLGNIRLEQTLFTTEGLGFQPISAFPYSVNAFFVFDGEGNSLSDPGGIIAENFPTATGFVLNYGLESDEFPANAVGLFVEDESGGTQVYVRELSEISTTGNRVDLALSDNYYLTDSTYIENQESLRMVTDEIFQGGRLYVSQLPAEGLTVYRLLNPCNDYEIFLVQ